MENQFFSTIYKLPRGRAVEIFVTDLLGNLWKMLGIEKNSQLLSQLAT